MEMVRPLPPPALLCLVVWPLLTVTSALSPPRLVFPFRTFGLAVGEEILPRPGQKAQRQLQLQIPRLRLPPPPQQLAQEAQARARRRRPLRRRSYGPGRPRVRRRVPRRRRRRPHAPLASRRCRAVRLTRRPHALWRKPGLGGVCVVAHCWSLCGGPARVLVPLRIGLPPRRGGGGRPPRPRARPGPWSRGGPHLAAAHLAAWSRHHWSGAARVPAVAVPPEPPKLGRGPIRLRRQRQRRCGLVGPLRAAKRGRGWSGRRDGDGGERALADPPCAGHDVLEGAWACERACAQSRTRTWTWTWTWARARACENGGGGRVLAAAARAPVVERDVVELVECFLWRFGERRRWEFSIWGDCGRRRRWSGSGRHKRVPDAQLGVLPARKPRDEGDGPCFTVSRLCIHFCVDIDVGIGLLRRTYAYTGVEYGERGVDGRREEDELCGGAPTATSPKPVRCRGVRDARVAVGAAAAVRPDSHLRLYAHVDVFSTGVAAITAASPPEPKSAARTPRTPPACTRAVAVLAACVA